MYNNLSIEMIILALAVLDVDAQVRCVLLVIAASKHEQIPPGIPVGAAPWVFISNLLVAKNGNIIPSSVAIDVDFAPVMPWLVLCTETQGMKEGAAAWGQHPWQFDIHDSYSMIGPWTRNSCRRLAERPA